MTTHPDPDGRAVGNITSARDACYTLQRNFKELAVHHYDLAVIGGGVTGAAAAYDAAQRGLSVCLLDRGDFGGATSANSLKVIHGGFRYLQSMNLPRVREAVRERRAFLCMAPHLIAPLPCLVAARDREPMRSRPAFFMAALLYNILSLDRNQDVDPSRLVPACRVISRQKARELFPAWGPKDCDGAMLWYDALAFSTERLSLELVRAAVESGANALNHAEVYGLFREDNKINGLQVRDRLTGQRHEVTARVVLNASGPWLERFRPQGSAPPRRTVLARAINLIINRRLAQVAVGLESSGQGASDEVFGLKRNLFLVPWGEHTLAGTSYTLYQGDPDQARPGAQDMAALLAELNQTCPGLNLSPRDVSFYHYGLLPLDNPDRPGGLSEHHRVLNHSQQGVANLISLEGVKYTTGRALAERAVDQAFQILGQESIASSSAYTRLPGARPPWPSIAPPPGWDPEPWQRLTGIYGSLALEVAEQTAGEDDPQAGLSPDCPVTVAEVLHAVRLEMASKLNDLVLRRTALGAAGRPPAQALTKAGNLMAAELGWDQARLQEETKEVEAVYQPIEHLRGDGQ
jgi:glycerol-3-phosphate dehydrogenase